MSRIVRRAGTEDIRAVYDLQNGPFRQEVFDSPPVSFEEFQARTEAQAAEGTEHYFILQEDDVTTGFVWFSYADEIWYTTIWGRWLRTLVYASAVTGFDLVKIPRQVFLVRQTNRRMIKVAEDPGYGFRKAGDTAGYVIRDEYPHLVVVRSNIYEVGAQDYYDRQEFYRSHSLSVEYRL